MKRKMERIDYCENETHLEMELFGKNEQKT